IASAHWETNLPMLTGSAKPQTIHDFSGFPEPLYRLRYAAPGAPEVAQRTQSLLKAQGLAAAIDGSRGLDHGAWAPLLYMYPKADIPVVQISVQPAFGPRHHVEVGRSLKKLSEEGVLIIGSGHMTHNLRDWARGSGKPQPDARDAGGEQPALRVDNVELAGDAVLVAQACQPQRLAKRSGARAFGVVALARARLRRKRRAHLAECIADRLLVFRERGALARLRRGALRLQAPAREDRLRHARRHGRDSRAALEQIGERRALAAERRGERDRREHLRAGDGQPCVGGRKAALGLNQVGAAQQQFGGQPGGHDRGLRLLVER